MASGTRISNPVMKYLRIDLSGYGQTEPAAAGSLQVLLAPAGVAGLAGAGVLSPLPAAAGAGAAAGALPSTGPVAVPVDGAVPPRKSVAYQPVPLSWKPAAVIAS